MHSLDSEGRSADIGEGKITLTRLIDQKKHEEWIELMQNGNQVGQLFGLLQWIYSKVLFLSDVVKKWEETIREDETYMQDLEKKLKALRSPFQSTLEAVVQSVGIEHQILLTHSMYPGNINISREYAIEEYDIKECLQFIWYSVGILALLQMFIKPDFTTVQIPLMLLIIYNSFV